MTHGRSTAAEREAPFGDGGSPRRAVIRVCIRSPPSTPTRAARMATVAGVGDRWVAWALSDDHVG
jgi:hypothetical protein